MLASTWWLASHSASSTASVTFVRTDVCVSICLRKPSRRAIASAWVVADPVRINCPPVAGSVPPKIRTWNRLPRWRMPVRSAGGCFREAMTASYRHRLGQSIGQQTGETITAFSFA